MRQFDRVKLFFGPYRTPRFKLGTKVDCATRGEMVTVGLSDGRIQSPSAHSLCLAPLSKGLEP
jgi:hypothetical protein